MSDCRFDTKGNESGCGINVWYAKSSQHRQSSQTELPPSQRASIESCLRSRRVAASAASTTIGSSVSSTYPVKLPTALSIKLTLCANSPGGRPCVSRESKRPCCLVETLRLAHCLISEEGRSTWSQGQGYRSFTQYAFPEALPSLPSALNLGGRTH